jgi:hypothetical protein
MRASFLQGEDSLCVNDWWNRARLFEKIEETNFEGLTGRPESSAEAVAWVHSPR